MDEIEEEAERLVLRKPMEETKVLSSVLSVSRLSFLFVRLIALSLGYEYG